MTTATTDAEHQGPNAQRTAWVLAVCGLIFVVTMLGVPCLLMLGGAVAESLFAAI